VKHEITHYGVPNIASSVARTASHALNNSVLTYVEEVATRGWQAFKENDALRHGLHMYRGHCTHEEIAGLLGWEYANIGNVLHT
jgi:alanine dehydrogenase